MYVWSAFSFQFHLPLLISYLQVHLSSFSFFLEGVVGFFLFHSKSTEVKVKDIFSLIAEYPGFIKYSLNKID